MNEAEFAEFSLLDLPDVCLENIIKHLDYTSRKQLELVCKKLYETVCWVDTDRYPLVFTNAQVVSLIKSLCALPFKYSIFL